MSDADEVRLVLPGTVPYGRVARVAASTLALRAGLGFTRAEDVRLAVDEVMGVLLRDLDEDDHVVVQFRVAPGALEVVARAEPPGPAARSLERHRSRMLALVTPLATEITVDDATARVELHFHR